jgi:KDO2-lipid IV(A) lauroyltransferase
MPGGPALLSLRTGAPLLAARVWYDGPYTRTSIVGPVQGDDVATMTQAVADELAQGIAAHPQDWHMLQRMWVES